MFVFHLCSSVKKTTYQCSLSSRGLWLGEEQGYNTHILNGASHQGKVNSDHSRADRSILIFVHLLPLPVTVDVIVCAAASGCLPLSISNI